MISLHEKLLQGEKTTEEDWNNYLLEAHRKSPSQTPRTFADYRTSDGKRSYDMLAQSLKGLKKSDSCVLDLACGDGFLVPFLLQDEVRPGRIIGIDMSDAELTVARQRVIDPRVSFVCAKAQSLPLEDSSVDLALCHMALMLMLPLEPVISELSRVLKPGGCFSAVIGNRRAKTGFWAELVEKSFAFVKGYYPGIQEMPTGDSRIHTEEGLRAFFGMEFGFNGITECVDFELEIVTTPSGVWEFMREMYFISMMAEPEQFELSKLLIELGREKQNSQGQVRFQFPMRKFTATKRGEGL